ncbi:hypothetical protein Zmor_018254 [Zophobas morio]|uniref:DDE Tnp4 domain-containing protein n=1 Tax=Zophobas morio TaxID=2755281 RepID=A0AA38I9N2_9CUCU|nr:hypothetical protein Zmor_018254 [Zophobas morio]
MAYLDGILHLFIVNHDENSQRILQNNRIQRQMRDASNPFHLPDRLFLKLFRLDKQTTLDFIDSIRDHMAQPLKGSKVPVHLRVLTAMHFFGHGSYQTGTGLQHPLVVSQPTVSRCIAEVSDVITRFLLNRWVKWPRTDDEKNSVKRGFRLLEPRLHNMLGVIDCTHIKIIAPSEEHPVHPAGPYYCRKGYYSINTQIIADTNRIIRAINARFPGSVHDAAIWSMSAVKRILQNNFVQRNDENYLLGDSGYPLEPWLLVRYPHVIPGSPEENFNATL